MSTLDCLIVLLVLVRAVPCCWWAPLLPRPGSKFEKENGKQVAVPRVRGAVFREKEMQHEYATPCLENAAVVVLVEMHTIRTTRHSSNSMSQQSPATRPQMVLRPNHFACAASRCLLGLVPLYPEALLRTLPSSACWM